MRCWEEFGMDWRSMELGILGEVEMDSGEGFQVLWGGVWVGSGSGRMEVNAGELGEVWGWILDGLEVWDGSGSEGRRRRKMLNFFRGGGRDSIGSLTLTQALSGLAKRCGRSGEGVGFNQGAGMGAGGFKFHRVGRLQLMAATGEATSINAAEEGDGKAERR